MDKEYLRREKEWEVGPDMSELAKKANALFQFLVKIFSNYKIKIFGITFQILKRWEFI